jgi:Protein of unknown function (DUF3102)
VVERRNITKQSKSKTLFKFVLCLTSREVIKKAREQAAQEGKEGKDVDLAAHAALIRRLGKRVITDIIEIGRRLKLAKDIVGHGGWKAWLEKEFGWSADTALNFMRVYELSEDFESRNFRDLRIAPSALYLLAKPSTPEEVRTEIIERAKAGEKITHKDVKETLAPDEVAVEVGLQPAKATSTEVATTNPTNDWREDIRRGFRKVLKVADDAIYIIGQQAQADVSSELRRQIREALEPLRSELPEIKNGGQALLDYFGFIENILADGEPLAEAAE